MALQGTFSGTTANTRITPTIAWSAVQSITGNYSDITATLTYRRNNSEVTQGKWSGTLTIADQVFEASKSLKITNTDDAVAITATARISHNENGQLSVTIRATGAISGSSLANTDVSGVATLDTIARASTVSAADAYIERRATVVVNRKSAAFSHSIGYQFGNITGFLDADGNAVAKETKFTNTIINFLLPELFYSQIPDAPSGDCTLTVCTYNGDTQIGEKQTAIFTVTAAPSLCVPEISGDAQDIGPGTLKVTGDPAAFVRYASKAHCTVSATPHKGATIKNLTIDGVDVTDTGVLDIPNIAKNTVVLKATDSRGYTATKTLSLNLIPYLLNTNNSAVKRTDPTSGNAILTVQGSCWKGNFGTKQNSVGYQYTIDGGQPSISKELPLKSDHTYSDQITLTGLDYTKSHTVTVKIYDQLRQVERTLTVQKGVPVFDWGEEDFAFHVPVDMPALTIGGVPLETYIQSIIAGGSK